MAKELAKAYNPSEVEDRTYEFWLKGGYFHAKCEKDKKPYTIVMPPPILQVSFIWVTLLIIPYRIF